MASNLETMGSFTYRLEEIPTVAFRGSCPARNRCEKTTFRAPRWLRISTSLAAFPLRTTKRLTATRSLALVQVESKFMHLECATLTASLCTQMGSCTEPTMDQMEVLVIWYDKSVTPFEHSLINAFCATLQATGCGAGQQIDDKAAGDELNWIQKGNYYGHPNHKRAENDSRQCVWNGPGTTSPLMGLSSSTDGLVEFQSGTKDELTIFCD